MGYRSISYPDPIARTADDIDMESYQDDFGILLSVRV